MTPAEEEVLRVQAVIADVVPQKELDERRQTEIEADSEGKIARDDASTPCFLKRRPHLLWLPVAGYLCAALVHDAQRALVPVCLAAVIAVCQLWDAFRAWRGKDLEESACWWTSQVAPFTRWILGVLILAMLALWGTLAWEKPERLVPGCGLLLLVLLTWLCSAHRGQVTWRPVITGILLQILIGLLIMRTTAGFTAFKQTGDMVSNFLAFADKGSEFVFGDGYKDFFAFKVLPVVIFFSSMVAAAYHLGLIQAVFLRIGWLMQLVMGTSYCESLMSAANIFLGQTEAPLLAKPFLQHLTLSEIHAVMTAGFASIAGGVMAVPWEAKTEVPWELKHHVQSGALEGPHLLTFTYHRGRWNHST
ncbi:unnamed protein product [Durusdinium trenchii]|uniref:Uncharacterized protein n=1 Tax=Durusdinium trenchii TaxID=1381693 RepID=A0ABP0P4E9_9DINO